MYVFADNNVIREEMIAMVAIGIGEVTEWGGWSSLKWGLVDKTGRETATPKYDEIFEFHGGLAAALVGNWEDGKWGFINEAGVEVIPLIYSGLSIDSLEYMTDDFSEGLVAACLDGKWGYINRAGEIAIPFEYEKAQAFKDGLATVQRDGKAGMIDKNGRVVVPFEYGYLGEVVGNYIIAMAGDWAPGRYGVISFN